VYFVVIDSSAGDSTTSVAAFFGAATSAFISLISATGLTSFLSETAFSCIGSSLGTAFS
jgi:hypothetical protein